jgi:RNA polymerase sigma-70 factor (ECF subfamily)
MVPRANSSVAGADGGPRAAQSQRDDLDLVHAAAAGDPAAMAAIWARYARLVRSVLRATLGRDGELDDLTQDVFLKLFRTVTQLRDGAALPAVLTRMAVRQAGMTLRWRRVRALVMLTPSTQLPDVAVVPPDPDVRRGLAVLYRLLDRVKPRHRMAFVLRDVLGMEMPEVAAALELSDTAARRALTEGRKRVLRLARHEPHLVPFLAKGSHPENEDGGRDD